MSESVAVAYLSPEDVRELHPELSEEDGERIVAWLSSNCTLADRPATLEVLIQEAMETLGMGDD